MELLLRSAQILKQEAEELGYQLEEVAEYVKQEQALDREERATWMEAEKKKRADEIHMAEIQAEEKRRAERKRAYEI